MFMILKLSKAYFQILKCFLPLISFADIFIFFYLKFCEINLLASIGPFLKFQIPEDLQLINHNSVFKILLQFFKLIPPIAAHGRSKFFFKPIYIFNCSPMFNFFLF